MLAVYTNGPDGRRKRWSPTTIAISFLAHGAAIAALAVAAQNAEAKPVREEVIAEWNLEDKPKPPPPPPPVVQPEPPKVELAPKEEAPRLETPKVEEPKVERPREPRPAPAPVKGDFVSPRPPETPPASIPAVNPNAAPITVSDFSGVGKEGDVVGAVDPSDKRAPTGHTEPAPAAEPKPEPAPEPSGPMEESEVDVRPSLRNADDMQRALERVYPSQLREAGVTGETVLQFVIDENGHVEPGSVEVVSSTDDAFSAAARRIVGSMRFSPARARGHTVRVTTTIPVRWTIAS